MDRAGRSAGVVSLALGGLSLVMVLPVLPWVRQVSSAEPYATIPDPPGWAMTSFMLAPLFGVAAILVFSSTRGRTRRTGAPPRPDLPATSIPHADRSAGMATWGFGLGATSGLMWIFVVLEALSRSGAP